VSRFFYAVILPSDAGEQIVCGEIQRENAFEVIKSLQRSNPKALEIYIRRVNEVPCL